MVKTNAEYMARIFISYKRVDKDKVFKIKDQIESVLGDKCWIDLDGIESDAQFANVIINAIDDCEVVLFMYSKAHTSIKEYAEDWTIRELHYANAKGKRIVIIKIDDTPLCGWFEFMYGLKQQVDLSEDTAVDKLLKDLQSWLCVVNEESLFVKGEKLFEAEQYEEALSAFMQAYESGCLNASKEIGDCYHFLGDQKSAIDWYIKGFEYGYDTLDSIICSMISASKEDQKKIFDFYLNKSEKGDTRFFVLLGECYYWGEGTATDYKKAYEWYLKAAELENPEGQYNIGYCYYIGKGVRRNRKIAFEWYLKSAENGYGDAQEELGTCYDLGIGCRKNEKKAFEWYLKAAEQGCEDAYSKVADCYWLEMGINEDPQKAFEWYLKSAESGDISSQCQVASFYFEGYGTKKNTAKAVEWYLKAAEQEDVDAIEWLRRHRALVEKWRLKE